MPECPDEGSRPQSLVEQHNGNYIAAVWAYIDRSAMPRWMKSVVRIVVFGAVVAVIVAGLLWPLFMNG